MISAIIITKNEEKMIEDCLKSLSFCEEIIIVDNGSTDNTKDICQRYTDKFFSTTTENFSEMRNLGAEKAQGEWLLYIDADERISDELKRKIIQAVKTDEYSGYELKRNNNFLGVWVSSGGWENEYLLRLIKKSKLEKWSGRLHETAKVSGKIGKINASISHYSHRDLSSMVKKTNEWSEIEANLRYDNNHPKMTVLRFVKLFFKELWTRLIIKKAWKDGAVGIIEAIYQSYSLLITYFKLWEKQIFV